MIITLYTGYIELYLHQWDKKKVETMQQYDENKYTAEGDILYCHPINRHCFSYMSSVEEYNALYSSFTHFRAYCNNFVLKLLNSQQHDVYNCFVHVSIC